MIRSSLVVAALVAAPVSAQTSAPQAAVQAAMAASTAGWNAGDLDRFVAIYAKDAMYVTSKGVVRGKAEIAERYRASFEAGGNVRGTLSMQMLAFRTLSDVHQLLVARWTLTPAGEGAKVETGLTTLVFERSRRAGRSFPIIVLEPESSRAYLPLRHRYAAPPPPGGGGLSTFLARFSGGGGPRP